MGKGDRRSRKSKIWRGTFGKTRPRHRRKKKTQKAKPT
ncbi:MAG: 30S ribosomal protein THX [Bacteroidota bacterium]